MATFEKTWQHGINNKTDTSSLNNSVRNTWWWFKAFLLGQLPIRTRTKIASGDNVAHIEVAGTTQDTFNQGLWYCLASSDATNMGCTFVAAGSNGASLPQATINVNSTTGFAGSLSSGATTIAAGSNGASLPQATINVANALIFPSTGGTILVTTASGPQMVAYTGTTSGSFTGCSGGTGAMSTGGAVNYYGTIYVQSSSGIQAINFTGTSGTTFTGCTGGAGTLSTNNAVYDGYDRLNGVGGLGTTTLQLGGNSATTNSGSAASFTTGATITGAVRLSGLANMAASDVGNFLMLNGASTAGNNSPPNTPFKIVNFVSSSSVDVYNPYGTTTDGYNGSIAWSEKNAYNLPGSTAGNYSTITSATGAHSWIVLQSPAALGPWYLMIDFNSAGSPAQTSTFVISKTMPSNTSATASTSQRPSSADEVADAAQRFHNSGSVFPIYNHGSLATDGSFMIHQSRGAGNSYTEMTWFFQVLANTKSADLYPAIMWMRHGDGSQALTPNQFVSTSGGQWFARNFNGTVLLTGSASTSVNGVAPIYLEYNGSTVIWADMTLADYSDSQYDSAPLYIICPASGQATLKGRLIDIRQGPGTIPEAFTEPNPSSPSSTIVGGNTSVAFWFPCNLPFLL